MERAERRSAERHLAVMKWGHPSLFRTRLDILDHLFAVIGNGYEWRRGRLAEKPSPERKGDKPPHGLPPVKDSGGRHDFYPLSQYSLLTKVPDGASPDWIAMAYEAALVVRDRSESEDAERLQENVRIASGVVADLERRFPQETLVAWIMLQ